jgi:hypothetical protein
LDEDILDYAEMAVEAPMPNARVMMARVAKARLFYRVRTAQRRSCRSISMVRPPGKVPRARCPPGARRTRRALRINVSAFWRAMKEKVIGPPGRRLLELAKDWELPRVAL